MTVCVYACLDGWMDACMHVCMYHECGVITFLCAFRAFLRLQRCFLCILGKLLPVCQTKMRPVLRKGSVKELFGSTLKKRLYLKKDLLGIREAAFTLKKRFDL